MRSSGCSSSTSSPSAYGELGTRPRARDPRSPEDADEDVLPLRGRLLRPAEHAYVPGLSRVPRRVAGAESESRRLDDPARPRARLFDPGARDLPPQELLLPGQPEGVPGLAVRPAALRRRELRRAGA